MSKPTPLPGVSPDTLLQTVREMETEAGNLRTSGGDALDRFNRYQAWSDSAAARLSRLVRPSDVERLVTTRRYWQLGSMDPAARSLASLAALVDSEMDQRVRAFGEARAALDADRAWWNARQGVLVVPDTSVFLHHDDYFDEIAWGTAVGAGSKDTHLFMTLLVIDELDEHKRSSRNVTVSDRNTESIRTRARVTLRRMNDLLPVPSGMTVLQPSRSPTRGRVTAEFIVDTPSHRRLVDPDQEIIDRASAIQAASARDVVLATFDTGMRLRAQAAGLQAMTFEI